VTAVDATEFFGLAVLQLKVPAASGIMPVAGL
jgi:hypothetical protein